MAQAWCGRPKDNGGFPTLAKAPEPTNSKGETPRIVPAWARARARTDKSEAVTAAAGSVGLADATARPSKLPRAPGPPPPLPEPATFTGIDGADVDFDVVEELPADVRVEVLRQMELWRSTRRGVRLL